MRDLAATFRTRIEMRQIGVRDYAKRIGGLGLCGRTFCCKGFLKEFQPVTIRVARNQDINIIDVREACDFAAGHIPGAISLPISTWSTAFGLTADKVNVIYGHSAVTRLVATASEYFAERGYHVVELEGGFEQWQRHNLPAV